MLRFAAATTAAVSLVSCSAGRSCTEAGAEPQVRITTTTAVPVGSVAEVCEGDRCARFPWYGGEATVPLELDRGKRAELVVRLRAPSGAVMEEARVSAEVQTFQPNGEGCPPAVSLVEIQRTAAGGYEPAP